MLLLTSILLLNGYSAVAADLKIPAEPILRQALQIDLHAYDPSHATIVGDLYNLTEVFQNLNKTAEAEEYPRLAQNMNRDPHGPKLPHRDLVAGNLGYYRFALAQG